MTSTTTYVDKNFYEELESSKDLKCKIDTVAKFAEKGEVQALTIYGLSLISGIWDEERMKEDLIRDQCIPVPKNPNDIDPYLVLPRDVSKGVSFIVRAANSSHLGEEKSVKRAHNILTFLQYKGFAGLRSDGHISYSEADKISYADAKILGQSAGSSTNKGFIQCPDVRPDVINLKNEPFSYYATTIRDRCMKLCILSAVLLNLTLLVMQILFLDQKPWLVYIQVNVLNLIFHIAPLGILAFLVNKFGIKEKMTLCNCKKIREAYSLAQNKLPQEFRDKSNIFETTPRFVQYLMPAKQVIFWVESIILTIWIGMTLNNFKNASTPTSGYFSGVGPNTFLAILIELYVMTFVISMWDKKLPDFIFEALDKNASGIFALMALAIFMNFFSIAFSHGDCYYAIERIEDKSNFYKIIQQKE